ncbi:zinc finger protein GIS2-like [Vicia villosa]|uniref:zinc finger protein GIS2-like n=1 Tax=Vicia villosa TaxID=3911 RepID=UPI00273BE583|nr:zinc finger protein GIS2-like [Vicia villosa]
MLVTGTGMMMSTGALRRFQRNNPPVFKGKHEPDKAQAWLKAIEKIFRVMNCTDAQKVQFGTHMLGKEAEDWWNNTLQRFEEDGIEELIKYCPHYNTANAERSKCLKFGHKAAECKKEVTTCFKCGKYGHIATNYRGGSNVTCFNCGDKGHVSTKCDKPKKEQAKGKVFALSGAEATTDESLIQA